MINNKRGLSAIVTTLLVVVLVLVAVGIVWGVVKNVLTSGSESVELGGKCMNIDIRAAQVTCTDLNPDTCDVVIERTGAGSEEFVGLKIVFRDSNSTTNSAVIDEPGNVELLVGKTISAVPTTLNNPDSIELTVYFKDLSGNEQICSQTTSFNF